jgi:hypothetical protein
MKNPNDYIEAVDGWFFDAIFEKFSHFTQRMAGLDCFW